MSGAGFTDLGCTCDECSGAEKPQRGHCRGCRGIFNFKDKVEGSDEPFCSEECAQKKGAN